MNINERIESMLRGITYRQAHETRLHLDPNMPTTNADVMGNIKANALSWLSIDLNRKAISTTDAQKVIDAYNTATGQHEDLDSVTNPK